MDIRILLLIGGVIVVIVLVLYWQRQGVEKRPSAVPASEPPDWTPPTSPASDWGESIGLNQAQMAQIQAEIGAGRKIEAIKLYREFTGMGLKEAKETIEDIMRGKKTQRRKKARSFKSKNDDVMAQVQQAVKSGRKINAIKLYREAYNVGLKEAKDAVDEMERNLGR